MLPVSLWLQRVPVATTSTRPSLPECLPHRQLCDKALFRAAATGNEELAPDENPFDEDSMDMLQQRFAGRINANPGVQLVKGTCSTTLAPGNLRAVRDRLSMPAPAEFEDHDPWALRAIMEKRKRKEAEDEVWRARKALKYSHKHMNVDYFTDYRCRDADEEPARHYSHEEIMNIITNDWKNANPFKVEHQCNNPISVADWAGEGIEMPPDTDEWIREAGLTAFGEVLAPKALPSQDMLDAEFQGLEGSETAASDEGQDSSLSDDFSSFDMDDDGGGE